MRKKSSEFLGPHGKSLLHLLARPDCEATVGTDVIQKIRAQERWQQVELSDSVVERSIQLPGDGLVAIGGDGTLNLAGRLLFYSNRLDLPLVLVPAGTGNDLCRAILANHGLELEAFKESDQLIKTPVDMLRVRFDDEPESTCFLNMLSAGSSAKQAEELDAETKSTWGRWIYLVQFWKTVTNLELFQLRAATAQGAAEYSDVVNFFIGNGPTCGGGFRVVEGADYRDGKANLVVVRSGSASQWTTLAADFLRLKHLENPLVETSRSKGFVLEASQVIGVTLDGEPRTARKIEVEVLPQAIDFWLCSPTFLRNRWE